MIVGNERPQQIVEQFFAKIHEQGEVHFPFLLLSGPSHIGKTSLVEGEIAKLTGFFANQDYRPLYDLSELLGKQHVLKVEVSEKDQRVEIDGKNYMDLGARDVISRLSVASAGDYKVVYLENIERMNPSAANALLKTLEEPLSKRLIVASTTNKEALLDTILSRAFVVDFSPLSKQQVEEYMQSNHTEVSGEIYEFLTAFSLGRIGLISHYLAQDEQELEEMAEHFAALLE
jgi:DNA polymerase-3 subunit delta'